jgi:hypothetical protein
VHCFCSREWANAASPSSPFLCLSIFIFCCSGDHHHHHYTCGDRSGGKLLPHEFTPLLPLSPL